MTFYLSFLRSIALYDSKFIFSSLLFFAPLFSFSFAVSQVSPFSVYVLAHFFHEYLDFVPNSFHAFIQRFISLCRSRLTLIERRKKRRNVDNLPLLRRMARVWKTMNEKLCQNRIG